MSEEKIIKNREKFDEIYQKYKEELKTDTPIVVLCGPGKCDDGSCEDCDVDKKRACFYYERLKLRQCLSDENFMPALFEEDFDLVVASLEETIILHSDEVEKVVVIPAPGGSATELGQFARDPIIRPKIIVLVPYEFHPWYSDSESYLTSLYVEILGLLGHIHPFDSTGEKHPQATEIVSLIMQSYRLNKLAGLL